MNEGSSEDSAESVYCSEAPEARLNRHVIGLQPSSTTAINARSDALRQAGRTIFKMGLGQSPFPVPPPVVEALQQSAFQKDYLPVSGLAQLRDAVARHHWRTFSIETRGGNVLIGPGSKELMFILQLVYEGDLVIPAPSWVSYAPQARILGRRISWLETRAADGWRVTPEALEGFVPDRFCPTAHPRVELPVESDGGYLQQARASGACEYRTKAPHDRPVRRDLREGAS